MPQDVLTQLLLGQRQRTLPEPSQEQRQLHEELVRREQAKWTGPRRAIRDLTEGAGDFAEGLFNDPTQPFPANKGTAYGAGALLASAPFIPKRPPFKVPPAPTGRDLYYDVLNQIGRMRYGQDPVNRAELFGEFGDASATAYENRVFQKPFVLKEVKELAPSRFDYRHPHTLNQDPNMTPETEDFLQNLLKFFAD